MTEERLQHLLSISDLDRPSAERILDTAETFLEITRRPVRKVPTLRGKTVVTLFYEASTRTRTSFELAAKRMGADLVNVAVAQSSTKKGETLRDTVANIEAMHADVIIIRHQVSGAPHYVARHSRASVVNAGDGMHAHPTQALLDTFTIRKHKGSVAGLTVAICGDITHSRVARSDLVLLNMLGAKVRLAGPRTVMPRYAETLGCEVYDRIEPAIEGADVVMMLRIQQERLAGAMFPTLREYSRMFGLTQQRLKLAKPDAIVMHPGPLNRGVEINDDVADGDQSVILNQVESGVAVRMSVLYWCAREPEQPVSD